MTDLDAISRTISTVTLVVAVVLFALASGRMTWRLLTYRALGIRPSIIFRRDFALMGAFLLTFGSGILIRAMGWMPFFAHDLPRLILNIVLDVVDITALTYWVWAEYRIIGNRSKEND